MFPFVSKVVKNNITFGINKGDISLNFFTNMESK